jgi:hypothetical protein
MFSWQVHVPAMFNSSPITMTTNDVAMQNMLMLTYNILPRKTCMKPGGNILDKGAK